MKKNLLFFALIELLCGSAGFAQPVFTSAYDFQIGQAIQMQLFEQNSLSPGPEGANRTWSFTSVPTGDLLQASIIAPAGTPAAAQFPLANKVFRFASDSADFFRYYKSTAQQTEDLGSATYFNSPGLSPFLTKMTDTRIDSRFPLNFGQSFSDTYASDYNIEFGGQVFSKTYTKGNLSIKYDAYGTLSTPTGTFNNCIRMRLNDAFTDSTVYPGIPIPPVVNTRRKTVFVWFQSNANEFPVRFQLEQDTISGTGGIPEPTVTGYYSLPFTGVLSSTGRSAMKITPNPASSFIEFDSEAIPQTGYINLISGSGQHWECPVSGGKADIREIPPGFYVVLPGKPGLPGGRLIKK